MVPLTSLFTSREPLSLHPGLIPTTPDDRVGHGANVREEPVSMDHDSPRPFVGVGAYKGGESLQREGL